MTVTDAGLMPLVMQLGRARASVMDVPVVLASLCSAMPAMLGVAGAVILVAEPAQADGVAVTLVSGTLVSGASDAKAARIGETQQRAGVGPLLGVLRSGRPLFTADLTRVGPPVVATAASENGFVSSLVLPVEVDGAQVGALQLLGDAQRPVLAALSDILRPLLEVLAARLADFIALQRAADAAAPRRRSRSRSGGAHAARDVTAGVTADATADATDAPTRALPAVPAQRSRRSGRHSA